MAALAPTTRRDFLRGRALADAAESEVRESRAPAGERWTQSARVGSVDSTLISASRRAMACNFEVVLPVSTPRAVEAASAALDEIDRLEDQLTVYRETSEVSRINFFAAATPVPIDERLFELFETALRLTDETGGAFDIAAGALINAWGFFRGPKRVPAPDELARVLERVGSRHIVLDRAATTIEFRRPGVEINLGAIGKGYALDRAAELLRNERHVSAALLQGGRSSVLAIGAPAGDARGWLLSIAHPHRPDEPVATVRLRDAALGTSGATYQSFDVAGRRFGHILDPRTGWPAESRSCVSVIAPTGAEADALSTALFILGSDKAREYCEQRPECGAVVVSSPTENEAVNVGLFGRAKNLVELTSALHPQPSTLNPQP